VCALPPHFCRIPAATRINLSSILGRDAFAAASRSRSSSISRRSHLLALSSRPPCPFPRFFPLFLSAILSRPVAMEPLYRFYGVFRSRRNGRSVAYSQWLSITTAYYRSCLCSCSRFLRFRRGSYLSRISRSSIIDRITSIDSIDRVSILPPLKVSIFSSEITSRVRTPRWPRLGCSIRENPVYY